MIIQRQYVKIIRFCSHFIGIAEKNRIGLVLRYLVYGLLDVLRNLLRNSVKVIVRGIFKVIA